MKKENRSIFYGGLGLLAAFVLWTVAVCWIDVQAIGPWDSAVGFATLNHWVHSRVGVHLSLYVLTDWLSLVPLGFVLGFTGLGLYQWAKRKQFRKVDRSILVLGGFYVAVMAVFLLFEVLEINYRPVLLEGVLEASYPSSTTMLVLCVMPTAMMELGGRIQNEKHRKWLLWLLAVFTAFMVIGRLISGVHWVTDIVGGALLSAGLVMLYASLRDTP